MPATRLPFTIMDELQVHSNTPLEPTTVQLEVFFDDRVDADRLRTAIRDAAAVHPMARARLEPSDGAGPLYWRIDREPELDPLRVVAGGPTLIARRRDDFFSRPIPLHESPPFRALLARTADSESLMLSVHHAAADGIGSVRLLQSVLRAYGGNRDPRPRLGPARARQKVAELEPPGTADLLEVGRTEWQRMRRAGGRVSALSPDGAEERPGYGFRALTVDVNALARAPIRAAAQATINDLLIAASSMAASSWIEQHGGEADRISVAMPMNARPRSWVNDVVANIVSGESVSVPRGHRTDLLRCVTEIARWTTALKTRPTGMSLFSLAQVPDRGVSMRRTAIRANDKLRMFNPVGTLVLSNLGRVDFPTPADGDPAIESVSFSPPAAMPCGLGIGAASVGETLTLTVRHRWALWSGAAARAFARLLQSQIRAISEWAE